jgi:hypothetical protein
MSHPLRQSVNRAQANIFFTSLRFNRRPANDGYRAKDVNSVIAFRQPEPW